MTTLTRLLDTVLLHGTAELHQLSRQLQASPALVQAMLEKLEAMGKIERIDTCATGCCANCPEGNKCQNIVYRALPV